MLPINRADVIGLTNREVIGVPNGCAVVCSPLPRIVGRPIRVAEQNVRSSTQCRNDERPLSSHSLPETESRGSRDGVELARW